MTQYFRDIYDAVSSAFKGMRITGKHLAKKPVTLQFPDERWVLPERFKGFVINDTHRCDACLRCAKVCPVDCIYIETTGKAKDRYMYRYAIDYNKCIWCGLCTIECPTDACQHSLDYDHALYKRQRLVYEFASPAEPIPCHKETRLDMGYYVPNAEAERAKIAAKKEAARVKAEEDAKAAAEKPAEPETDAPDEGKGE
jgi:NADH-quinone oxidoreductase subunit I